MPGKTILFADDSATMRAIVEKTFFAEDFDVVTVPSGEAAIQKAKEIQPAIVIADAGMMGTNGYDVCDAIRHEPSVSGTPVIIMSGISSPYDEARGTSVQATEHVKKPFDTTRLIELVTELSAGAPQRAAAPAASAPSPAPSDFARQPVPPSRPASPSLHGFQSLSGAGTPKAPSPSMGGQGSAPSKSTMEFTRPSAIPVAPEPEPIELSEEVKSASEKDFHVGTLAELAQMDESGATVRPEERDDAIELDTSAYAPPAAAAKPPAPAPLPLSNPMVPSIAPVKPKAPVRSPSRMPESPGSSSLPAGPSAVASAAAAEIVSRVDGLSSAQAEAILALTEDVIEKVVWEVVPDLAETMIREAIARLTKE